MLDHPDGICTERFPASATLGEAVTQWAQQTGTPLNAIKLRHASDEEYLSDDHWWSPLGQLRLVADGVLLLEVTVNTLNLVRPATVRLLLQQSLAVIQVKHSCCVCMYVRAATIRFDMQQLNYNKS